MYLVPVILTMITSLNLQRIWCPNVNYNNTQQPSVNAVTLRHSNFRRPSLHNRCLSANTSSFQPSSASTTFTSSVGSPSTSVPQWNLTQRHVTVLNFIACSVLMSFYFKLIFLYEINGKITPLTCYHSDLTPLIKLHHYISHTGLPIRGILHKHKKIEFRIFFGIRGISYKPCKLGYVVCIIPLKLYCYVSVIWLLFLIFLKTQ